MTPPKSLEERAEDKTKDFEYTVICPESEKTAFRDGYIWGARVELRELREEMIESLKSSNGGWQYCLEEFIERIDKRMK